MNGMTNIDEAKARLRGSLMDYGPRAEDEDICTVLDALDAAEQGLYDVYVNLGEDTDGARNARELFGPMVNTTPGEWVPRLVSAYRSEMEAELDVAERERDEARHIAESQQAQKFEVEDRWRGLAAVIERVREWANDPYSRQMGGIAGLDNILESAPVDVLRQVKAEAWDEAIEEQRLLGPANEADIPQNPYRIEKGEQSGSLQGLGGGFYRVSGARVDPLTGRYITNESDIEKGEQ